MNPEIAIMGGSGLYALAGTAGADRRVMETPFGPTSDPIELGTLNGVPVAFLSRHGAGHRLLPSEVPYRANIWALKALGVKTVVSFSAVGSLQPKHAPETLRLPDQFIDRTQGRASSFFGEGLVAHVALADPTCPWLRSRLLEAGHALALPMADGGTYVCMDGPGFSTRAESRLHQSWGADLIGMTQVTEARLAREAELCYACIALVTDYDAWREEETGVDAASVLKVMHANVDKAQALLRKVVPQLSGTERPCACGAALKAALYTVPEAVTPVARKRLDLLISKYGYGEVR